VFGAIQRHSHRQPERSGDANVEVVLVDEGALQVVGVGCRDAAPRPPGSLKRQRHEEDA